MKKGFENADQVGIYCTKVFDLQNNTISNVTLSRQTSSCIFFHSPWQPKELLSSAMFIYIFRTELANFSFVWGSLGEIMQCCKLAYCYEPLISFYWFVTGSIGRYNNLNGQGGWLIQISTLQRLGRTQINK